MGPHALRSSVARQRASSTLGTKGQPRHRRGVALRAEDIPMKPLRTTDISQTPPPPEPPVEAPVLPASAPPRTETADTTALVLAPETSSEPASAPVPYERVLVAGATGGVGRRVVEQLSGRGTQVVALVRDVAKARQTLPVVNVDVVQGDLYQFASLPGALDNVDAVICAAGFNDMLDPLGPFKVDYTGTVNLVEACKQAGIGRLVLVTSLGTDDGLFSPLGPILFWKKRAEEHLQRSGLTYTIVRPGGLVSDAQRDPAQRGMLPAALAQVFGQARARGEGNLVTGGAGTFGLPPKKSGSVLRSKVAECCIEALNSTAADDSVVELIADTSAPVQSWKQLFSASQFRRADLV